ncbi:MAG TPA: hypothetical protein PK074_11125, partial [Spirochaetales bacterium]|nr:hypothetical protein [Spirochaetales bacterium]
MDKLPRSVRPARCRICPIARKPQYYRAFAAIILRLLTSILPSQHDMIKATDPEGGVWRYEYN